MQLRTFNSHAPSAAPFEVVKGFFESVERGEETAIDAALSRFPGLASERYHGCTALMHAARAQNPEATKSLRRLLLCSDAAAFSGSLDPGNSSPMERSDQGKTALMMAARRGSVERLRLLLSHSHVEAQDQRGCTALLYAVEANQVAALDWLLPHCNVHVRDRKERTALMLASSAGSLECVSRLLPLCDAQAVDLDGESALWHAAANAHLDCVKQLLPHSNPLARNKRNDTLLRIAVKKPIASTPGGLEREKERVEVVALIARTLGGDPRGGLGGLTALMLAARLGCKALIQTLLAYASPQEGDDEKRTALMHAAERGHLDCVRLLTPVSPVDHKDMDGETAFHLALARRNMECADLLASYGSVERSREILGTVPNHLDLPQTRARVERDDLEKVGQESRQGRSGPLSEIKKGRRL